MLPSLALLVMSAAPAVACPAGQTVGPDTQGHCCWPQQAWSASRSLCIGVPVCPPPLTAQGETCTTACPVGQAVGPDTQGNCCWPRQVWATSQQRCVGVPECPAGLSAQGEACVDKASQPAPPPPPPLTTAPGPQVGAAPPAATPPAVEAAAAPVKTHTERRARKGLVITGAALLGVGYLIALATTVGGAAWAAAFPENTCWRYVSSVAWIPIIGPAISIAGQSGLNRGARGNLPCTAEPLYPLGVALAVIDTALQVTGLSLLIVGLVARETVEVPDEPGTVSRSSGFSFEPYVTIGAPGSSLGITAGARW